MSNNHEPADIDIDYLHREAKRPISEIDEVIFVELVGKNWSDGKSDDEARKAALDALPAN